MEGETNIEVKEDSVRYFGTDYCNDKAELTKKEVIQLIDGSMEVVYKIFTEEEILVLQGEHVKHDEIDPATGKWKDYHKEEWQSYTIALICASLRIPRKDYDSFKRNRPSEEFKKITSLALKLNGFGLTDEERDAEKNVVGQGL